MAAELGEDLSLGTVQRPRLFGLRLTRRNIPDFLSVVRLFAAPMLVLVARRRVPAVLLVAGCAVTDVADGALAWRWGVDDVQGARLDSAADAVFLRQPDGWRRTDATQGYIVPQISPACPPGTVNTSPRTSPARPAHPQSHRYRKCTRPDKVIPPTAPRLPRGRASNRWWTWRESLWAARPGSYDGACAG